MKKIINLIQQIVVALMKKINNVPGVILLCTVIVGGVLGLVHLIYYLLTKGVILVVYKLFDVNFYDKFWFVYLGVFILACLFNLGNKNAR